MYKKGLFGRRRSVTLFHANQSHTLIQTQHSSTIQTHSHYTIQTQYYYAIQTQSHYATQKQSRYNIQSKSHYTTQTQSYTMATTQDQMKMPKRPATDKTLAKQGSISNLKQKTQKGFAVTIPPG